MNDETIRDAAIANATSLVKDLGPNLEETNEVINKPRRQHTAAEQVCAICGQQETRN